MAKKEKVKKGKGRTSMRPDSKDQNITKETLREFGRRNMTAYALEVNLGRSIPELVDGLKPVQRRVLWAASQFPKGAHKTAQIVGSCLGNYHPHGDSSVSSAIETLVHHPTPTMEGHGEWGSLIDSAAAARYTNTCLSKFGRTFFESDYINKEVTSFVPTYTDKDVEPVTLPAQMPFVLMTGATGVGVGITTDMPSFTPESLIDVMERLLDGEKLDAKDFAKSLKYDHKWGGSVVNTKENRKGWLQMFESPEGKVLFEANLEVYRDEKRIVIADWPPGLNPEKFVEKVRDLPECGGVDNVQGLKYEIRLRKDHNFDQFDKFEKKVRKLSTVSQSFKCVVTKTRAKVVDGVVKSKTDILAMSVPELLVAWLKERIKLELKSLAFRIKKQKAAIAYSELLLYATKGSNLDVIIHAVRKTDDPEKHIMKKLKLTEEQAKQILALQLRQLSRLEEKTLNANLKDQKKVLAQLEKWEQKPKKQVRKSFAPILDAIKADRKRVKELAEQELTIV
ncbi:hypothetical protein [Burkholderia phage BCSR5]|nr:hypothetical protein [Burkholderia phage BCSR5]